MTTQTAAFKVFICYEATTGLGLALHLKRALEKHCVLAFVAGALPEGVPWSQARWRALAECIYFVVILTISAPQSPEMKKEIKRAQESGKRLLPYRDCQSGLDIPRKRFAPLFKKAKKDELQIKDFASPELLASLAIAAITEAEGKLTKTPFVDGLAPQAAKQPIPAAGSRAKQLQQNLQSGKTREAIAQARLWVREGKGLAIVGHSLLARAFLIRGDSYFQRGSFARARHLYRQAAASARHAQEKALLAYCWYELGAATGMMGDNQGAIRLFTRVIRALPHLAEAYYNRGNAYYHKGQHDRAIADYTTAIQLDPRLAPAYSNRGIAYAAKKDYGQAIPDFNRAIELDPSHANAYYNRGNAYAAKGDYERAIADYNKAIELNPSDADASNNRGVAYGQKKDYDRAILDFTKAIELDPSHANAYYNRGLAYFHKEDYDRAIADYTKAIELDPHYAQAYYNRGNAYAAKKDYDRAIADYTTAIELDPSLAPAYNNRGNAYAHKGDFDRTIADYTKAIELDPSDAPAYNNRGAAYAAKKDYDQAIADYDKAIQLNPSYAQAMAGLGLAYLLKGDAQNAAPWLEKALENRESLPDKGQLLLGLVDRLGKAGRQRGGRNPP